jgi:hypothetical protein
MTGEKPFKVLTCATTILACCLTKPADASEVLISRALEGW